MKTKDKNKIKNEKQVNEKKLVWFGLIWFYVTSTIVGY